MVQKLHICKNIGKSVFCSAFGFSLFLHTLSLCHILLFGCWIFSIPSECRTVWIQIRPNILSGLTWVQTVCKGYQQMKKVATSWQRVKCRTFWYYFLAKTLAKVNFILLQPFPFGSSVGYNKFWARVSSESVTFTLTWPRGTGIVLHSGTPILPILGPTEPTQCLILSLGWLTHSNFFTLYNDSKLFSETKKILFWQKRYCASV